MIKSDVRKYSGKLKKKLHTGQISEIYLLSDGRIFKFFNPNLIEFFKKINCDIEKKVVDSFGLKINSKIKRPLEVIYLDGKFCGYIMDRARGISFNEFDSRASLNDRGNLERYALIHSNLEQIVKGESKIVFPDLLTCDNIYIDENLGIELIDYDGFQVGNNPTVAISTSLGDQDKLMTMPKYYNPKTRLFTKELDIKSLVHLYFLDVFNIDLNKVGQVSPFTGEKVTFDEIFELINLDDYDVMNKVWKVFQDGYKNEYLGEDVFDIANTYKMEVRENPLCKGAYVKKLRRK